MICSGSSYENLIETENWKEIKAAHNTLFSRQLRANYRVGYWEYIIQHTKPLGIVPADMRAGTKMDSKIACLQPLKSRFGQAIITVKNREKLLII